jgi:hypothetical protein
MHPQQVTYSCEGSKRALHSRPLAALAASAGNVLRSEHRCRLVRYLNCLSAMLHHSMTEWILGRLDLDDDYPIRQHSQMAAILGDSIDCANHVACRDDTHGKCVLDG